ncbi:MAG: CTP synthase [Rikenellaceae bacterium]|nr:CTP synthase [Rikenellaceae bacterium]MBR2333447.1 CTP synthase [Rikenellaceae bacterium]MBR2443344.1 CTP synthase [Rikenellaceae bacterium]
MEKSEKQTKYIFVTGGVASSLGKGIIAASLAKLLQARGYSVTNQKCDPYINVDPGTLSPYEHGECYVTEDGAVTDLDLGHYERFTATPTSQANGVTTGRIYQNVINKERSGQYQGKTVQVVPHITDEIKRSILKLGTQGKYDIIITEIGGTVGDLESLPYIEAVRQLRYSLGPRNTAVVHLTLVPYMAANGELKTKPTQHSVKTLQEYGVQPDMLILRTEHELNEEVRRKVALFCNVNENAVFESIDVPTIYEVPLKMHAQHLDDVTLEKLNLPGLHEADMSDWEDYVHRVKNTTKEVHIALIGKYVALPDAYKSISESFIHAGASNGVKVRVNYINAESVTAETVADLLKDASGVLVAPGFGNRGVEGKIEAVRYARENNIPMFGINLGMHSAVIEFARNVLGHKDADSTEFNHATSYPIIDLCAEQKSVTTIDGTMRQGAYACQLAADSLCAKIYGTTAISERHRHRYEFNNKYMDEYRAAGMKPVGINPETGLVEVVELEGHPWFVAVEFHPEYKSNVKNPHPLFVDFVRAACEYESKNQ